MVDWSNILIKLAAGPRQSGVTISGGNAKHNAAGAVAITTLTGDGWTVTDAGLE